MTVEHRCVVGLGDIRALNFECKKCGVRLSVAPHKMQLDKMRSCAFCGEPWLNPSEMQKKTAIHPLLLFLSAIEGAIPHEKDSAIGVIVRLEFDDPNHSGSLPSPAK